MSRIRVLEKNVGDSGPLLRARVRGTLGPYLAARFVLLIGAAIAAAFFAVRELLRAPSGELAGPIVLGVIAAVLGLIAGLIGYELVLGQPVRVDRKGLDAIGGRVAAGDLARFEMAARGALVDVRAVKRDARRVDVALGLADGDARELVALLESTLRPARA